MDKNDFNFEIPSRGDNSFSDVDTDVKVEAFFPTRSSRNERGKSNNRKQIKRRQFTVLFLSGVLVGILLSNIFSLIFHKKDAPAPLPETPVTTAPETPVASVVDEIPVVTVQPNELMEGRNHSNAADGYAYDVEQVKEWMTSGRDVDEKLAFLTFDDGPGKYTQEILDVLKEKEVPATFFLLGTSIEKTGSSGTVWKRYVEEGHALATHTYSHDYNVLYSNRTPVVEKFKEELEQTEELLKERMGETFHSRVFRFPGGSMSWKGMTETKESLKEIDVIDIDWNGMTGDSESASKRPGTAEDTWTFLQDGLSRTAHPETLVLLMHDTKENTAKFLGEIIDKLESEGYEFGILY